MRWIARFCLERDELTLEDVDEAAWAFVLMRRGECERALATLQVLCA